MEKSREMTNTEDRLSKMDKDLAKLNDFRLQRKKWATSFKIIACLCCLILFVLFELHKSSTAKTEKILEKINLIPQTGNAQFSESGELIGINYNQTVNFDEFLSIEP
jgi:hypothetical protein